MTARSRAERIIAIIRASKGKTMPDVRRELEDEILDIKKEYAKLLEVDKSRMNAEEVILAFNELERHWIRQSISPDTMGHNCVRNIAKGIEIANAELKKHIYSDRERRIKAAEQASKRKK